jgi:hypothetical protein
MDDLFPPIDEALLKRLDEVYPEASPDPSVILIERSGWQWAPDRWCACCGPFILSNKTRTDPCVEEEEQKPKQQQAAAAAAKPKSKALRSSVSRWLCSRSR